MGINEMEFQWRLNWWYRPTQLDGFESSVADYYDCFCDWKANMELNLCPADEADYVKAFIQNLKSDVRSRLPKYISSGSLICAFLAAKLEESFMKIDESFKKNDAHKPFDEMPSRVPSCSQASPVSSQSLSIAVENSCSTRLENNSLEDVVIADEDSSGLEDDDISSLERGASFPENETPKVFDDFSEPILEASGNVYAENEVEASRMVHHLTKVISVGLKSREEMVEVFYEVFDKGSNRISMKLDCQSAGLIVLDVMPKPNSSDYQPEEEYYEPTVIESVKKNESQLGEMVVLTFDPGIRSWVLSGGASINSSGMPSHSNEKLWLSIEKVQLLSNVELWVGNVDSIPRIYYVPQVFDPGISVRLCIHNKLFRQSVLENYFRDKMCYCSLHFKVYLQELLPK